MFNNNQERIIVTSFLVQESATYQPQYRREWRANVDADIQGMLINRFKNLKGSTATGALASGVAEVFLMPANQPGKEIAINGNWQHPVYRALLTVEVHSATGHVVRFVVTAFSDPVERTLGGSINNRMPFYITNIVQLRQFVDRTSGMAVPVTALGSANQILADNRFGGYSSKYDFRMRPMDVFSYISQQAMDLDTPQTDIYDERTVLSQTPIKSEVRNALPNAFVGKVLSAYKQAHDSSGEIGGTDMDQLSEAQGLIMEAESAQDIFLRALRGIRRHGLSDTVSNYFTLEELVALSPTECVVRPKVIPITPQVQKMRADGPGETWGKTHELQRMASFIKDTIPALMMENMIMRAHIKCSNRTFVDGRMTAQLLDWGTFSDVDVSGQIVQLENRIVREVLLPLSEQNTRGLEIDMLMFVDSDSRFEISLDGAPKVEFVSPTFAGSLLTPVLTDNPQAAFTMAGAFKDLGDMLTDAATQLPALKNAFFQIGTKRAF